MGIRHIFKPSAINRQSHQLQCRFYRNQLCHLRRGKGSTVNHCQVQLIERNSNHSTIHHHSQRTLLTSHCQLYRYAKVLILHHRSLRTRYMHIQGDQPAATNDKSHHRSINQPIAHRQLDHTLIQLHQYRHNLPRRLFLSSLPQPNDHQLQSQHEQSRPGIRHLHLIHSHPAIQLPLICSQHQRK